MLMITGAHLFLLPYLARRKRVELLGNCFWRESFEVAFGPERRGR